MRKLTTEKRATILGMLVEGISINSIVRTTGAGKITVLRLLADAGTFCAEFHEQHTWDLPCTRVEVDELWSFVGAKQKTVDRHEHLQGIEGFGDCWTFVALCSDSKFVVGWQPGDRDPEAATEFMMDLRSRLANRVQLSTDGHKAYYVAVPEAFGNDVDFGMLVKIFGDLRPNGTIGTSPVTVVGVKRKSIVGLPDMDKISTSYVERQNLTVRMGNRRFGRATNAFSKMYANHVHALALHYWFYNWARKHKTLKTTPAVAIGLADRAYTMLDLVRMIEDQERKIGGRLTEYLAASK